MATRIPRRPAAGFTLIELMIVLVIATILVAIAIPMYEHQIQESRRTEAKTALLDLAGREQRYFSVQNNFTTSFGDLGYAAAGSSPPSVTVGSGYYSVTVSVPAAAPDPQAANIAAPSFSFTATPVAGSPQANDTACASFTVDSIGYQSAQNSGSSDNTATCWGH
ncbi:MAG TPA: type IV pilin protein [Ktedonobacterales bacterium]|nr:type IV pilin protein [Ktedonobacterales bacterium]